MGKAGPVALGIVLWLISIPQSAIRIPQSVM